MFIDASYEGDLLALAGVPFHVGREARDEFGESLAGMRFIDDVAEVKNSKGHAEKIDTRWALELRRADGGFVEGAAKGVGPLDVNSQVRRLSTRPHKIND